MQQLAQESGNYWYDTQPMRKIFYNQLSGFMKGNSGTGQSLPSKTTTTTSAIPASQTVTPTNLPTEAEMTKQLQAYMNAGQSGSDYADNSWFQKYGIDDPAKYIAPGMVPSDFTQDNPEWAKTIQSMQNAMLRNAIAQNNASTTTTTGTTTGRGTGTSDFQNAYRYDPYSLPAFQPIYNLSRYGLEDQYSKAKENLLASTAQGGPLNQALTSLENQRAYSVGALPAQTAAPIIQDLVNKAYGYAFGAPATALQGLSSASGLQNASNLGYSGMALQAAMANQQNSLSAAIANQQNSMASAAMGNSMMGGLGSGIGAILGSVAFK